jgi:hypothetical protein
MTFTPEEKEKVMKSLTTIEIHVVEMKPKVEKNTKFRLYVTGFFIILIAGVGLFKSLYGLTTAISEDEINVRRSTKYYKQVHTR